MYEIEGNSHDNGLSHDCQAVLLNAIDHATKGHVVGSITLFVVVGSFYSRFPHGGFTFRFTIVSSMSTPLPFMLSMPTSGVKPTNPSYHHQFFPAPT